MIDPTLKHFEIVLADGKAYALDFRGEAMVRADEWIGLPWTLWDYTRHAHLSAVIAAGILHADSSITPEKIRERWDLSRFREYVRLAIDAVEYAHTGKTRAEREAEAKMEKSPGEGKAARRRPGQRSSS